MRKPRLYFVYLLTILFFILPGSVLAQTESDTVVRAILFYSPSCQHCHHVITEVLVPMTEEYGDQLQVVGIDTSQPNGSALYQTTINHFQIPDERRGVPTLIVNDVILVGSGEIPDQFPTMVEEILADGGNTWPDIPGLADALSTDAEPEPTPTPTPEATPTPIALGTSVAAAGEAASNTPAVYMAYFFDPTCLDCARVSAELDALQRDYPNLVVQRFDVNEEAALNEALSEKYDVPAEHRLMAPFIFVGDVGLAADEITASTLESIIEQPEAAALTPPWENLDVEPETATRRIAERFKDFSLLAVAGAGLLDGVNPCAFTTIIFFVSYLALVGRKGRDILLVGSAFTLAVFLTYLAMGLGLAEVVRQISAFALIGRLIYGATALICLVLAVMSLWDYIKIRQGRLTEISLQLPKALKRRVHDTIRTSSRMRGFVAAAFGAGILVSIFELACTGQVYLPTIVFVTGIAEMRWLAVAYLLLYNVMFVVPLIIVFGVTYFGTSSQDLTRVFQENAGTVKLLTALLFALLGGWLGYMILTI